MKEYVKKYSLVFWAYSSDIFRGVEQKKLILTAS
jgi:hypothetical protein